MGGRSPWNLGSELVDDLVGSLMSTSYPSGNLLTVLLLNMAIEIVDLPIENGGSFHGYVNVYQRVSGYKWIMFGDVW